jgi:hypothetical protein
MNDQQSGLGRQEEARRVLRPLESSIESGGTGPSRIATSVRDNHRTLSF